MRGGRVYGTFPRGWNVYSTGRQASGEKENVVSSVQHRGVFVDVLAAQ